jgi:hypothetical protein
MWPPDLRRFIVSSGVPNLIQKFSKKFAIMSKTEQYVGRMLPYSATKEASSITPAQ